MNVFFALKGSKLIIIILDVSEFQRKFCENLNFRKFILHVGRSGKCIFYCIPCSYVLSQTQSPQPKSDDIFKFNLCYAVVYQMHHNLDS